MVQAAKAQIQQIVDAGDGGTVTTSRLYNRIEGGGASGGVGYADLMYVDPVTDVTEVWEVKGTRQSLDTPAGRYALARQTTSALATTQRYLAALRKDDPNGKYVAGFRVNGGEIEHNSKPYTWNSVGASDLGDGAIVYASYSPPKEPGTPPPDLAPYPVPQEQPQGHGGSIWDWFGSLIPSLPPISIPKINLPGWVLPGIGIGIAGGVCAFQPELCPILAPAVA